MIVALDKALSRYAKLILRIADFFGIGKDLLMYLWALIGSVVLAVPIFRQQALFQGSLVFLLEVMFMTLMVSHWIRDKRFFDSLGVVRRERSDESRRARTGTFLMCMVLSFRYFGGPVHSWWLILAAIKLALPLYLWVYFDDETDGGKKVKLKDLVKSAAKKVRAMLLPNPAPTPAPQPS